MPTLRDEHELPPAPRAAAAIPQTDTRPESVAPSGKSTAAIVLGLGGAGAFLAGAGLGGVALATGGLSEGTRATAAAGVGLGGLGIVAAGVLWLVTPPAKRSGGASMAVVPTAGPVGGGVSPPRTILRRSSFPRG